MTAAGLDLCQTLDLCRTEVSAQVADQLRTDLEVAVAPGVTAADILLAAAREVLQDRLPREVQDTAQDFVDSPHEAFLLRGLPVPESILTPATGFTDEAAMSSVNALHLGLYELMGISPYAVPYENEGELFRNVTPVEQAAGITSSWGADTEFFWHSDNPNWPFLHRSAAREQAVPRYLGFLIVRNDEHAPTDVVSVDRVLGSLPDWALDQLRSPSFDFAPPASNDGTRQEGARQQAARLPVIEDGPAGTLMRFDDGAISCRDERSAMAFETLRASMRTLQGAELTLTAGDFLVFKNERVLHRRRAFEPLPVGRGRWLRRCYAS